MWIGEDTVSYSTVNVWRRAIACIATIILLVDIIIKIYHASGSSRHSFKKFRQVHIIIYLLLVAQW